MTDLKDKAKYLAAHHFRGKDATKRATAWLTDALLHKCNYCYCKLTLDNIQLDHRLPKNPLKPYTEKELEYVNSDKNFIQSCKDCNLAKGALTQSEFEYLLNFLERWQETFEHTTFTVSGNATLKYIVGVLKKHNSEKGKRRR